MFFKKTFFFLLFSIQFLFSEIPFVRVGILENVKEFTVFVEENDKLLIKKNGKVDILKIDQPVAIKLLNHNQIQILNKVYSLPLKFSSLNGKVIINKRIYPQEVEISISSDSLVLINIVNLEVYLYGVVPYEIDTRWTDEMLKVQAIIARTYTLSKLRRHSLQGYDLCSDVHCQVYRGLSRTIHTRVKKLVDATKGLVIVDENENPILAYYHAACGGGTENIKDIWGGQNFPEYLKGVQCEFCKNSPYASWSFYISKNDFFSILKSNGYNLKGRLEGIIFVDLTPNKRVKNFKIETNKESIVVRGEDLRKIFGYNKIRSTKIYRVEIKKDNIFFYGNGWGHGVGLCQWGANYLATKGYKFEQIIKYYYPNTKIKKIY